MCGIAGLCSLDRPGRFELETIKKMVAIQHHRGPDETGIYIDDHAALGHARLSIIDLSSGSQPIHNEDKSLWIVYNGEIFNYPELREDLIKAGHKFYTTSDTEVLLHLYEQKGPACLADVNGQFGFAIWDSNKKELFIGRDRIGIRPLNYTIHNNTLVFASEIKAIFTIPQIKRAIDPISMDQICTFWTTLKGRTAFQEINELPPGHYLTVKNGNLKIEKYWTIPFYARDEQITDSPADIAENIDHLLDEAIRIRLRADVQVGCYLSGGLDSSGITAKIVRKFNADVHSFGIRFEEGDFDEGEHQTKMASELNVNHTEIIATNELIGQTFPDVVWHTEKPLLRTAPTPLYLLSGLVNRSGLKVVLTGEGADEFFGGYNILRETKVRKFWSRQPDSKNRPELFALLYPYIFKNPRLNRTLQSFFSKGLYQPDNPFFSHIIRWANTARIKTFFSNDLKDRIGQYDGYEELKANLPREFDSWDYISRAQYLESSIFLSNYLLSSQGDRVAMANSLEIRLPYLDPNIMDYMGRVPRKWKILGLDEKHILKKAFKKDLPPSILSRSKHPYRAPISQSLLTEKTAPYNQHILSQNALRNTGLFDHSKVSKLLTKLQNSQNVREMDNMALVAIISAQTLADKFIQNFHTQPIPDITPNVMVDKRNS